MSAGHAARFAHEDLDGESIDAYCRTHALPVRERVALLLQVMAAVSHAHSRLAVHRDLKPSNILVTRDAKVKLLEGDSTRRTALTELSGRALTLDYASREQIRGEPIGTASDVYSPGVVTYELLTEAKPYRLKRESAAAPDSLGYRMRKFVRRNRVPLTAATAVSVSLLVGLSVAVLQTREQAYRAAAVQTFIRQVFGASNPQQAQGRDIGARELLRLGAARLETDLQDQPDVLADLQHEIGDILHAQGANVEAKPHLEKAIALYERLGLGDTDPAVEARLTVSDLLLSDSQYGPAGALAQRCLDLAARRFEPPHRWALHARANLAFIRGQQGEAKAAAATLELALADP